MYRTAVIVNVRVCKIWRKTVPTCFVNIGGFVELDLWTLSPLKIEIISFGHVPAGSLITFHTSW